MTVQVPPGPRIRAIRDARPYAKCADSRWTCALDRSAGNDPSSVSPTGLRRDRTCPTAPVLPANRQHCCRPLLRRHGRGEPLASLGASALEDSASGLGLHARSKAVLPKPLDATRLISSLHLFLSPPSVPCRLSASPSPCNRRRWAAGCCAASAPGISGSPKRSRLAAQSSGTNRSMRGNRSIQRSEMSYRVG